MDTNTQNRNYMLARVLILARLSNMFVRPGTDQQKALKAVRHLLIKEILDAHPGPIDYKFVGLAVAAGVKLPHLAEHHGEIWLLPRLQNVHPPFVRFDLCRFKDREHLLFRNGHFIFH